MPNKCVLTKFIIPGFLIILVGALALLEISTSFCLFAVRHALATK